MTRFLILIAVLLAALQPLQAASIGYYRYPTIHDDQIVFVCEGDLWQVSTAGGAARRITAHPALEVFPHFSPDGQTIAFTADYEGNSDVYTMPTGGGEPRRLTFGSDRDDCIGWTPDGKFILFRAHRNGLDTDSTTYEVAATGGHPFKLNVGVCEAASFSADGKQIAFNPFVWTGTWKRYRGGTAPKIWVGDLNTNKFSEITKDDAVDQGPMWIGDRIYFLSERNFPTNLWSCKPDGSDARQETHHTDYDARFADSDGKQIVYTHNAELWVFDVKTGQTKKIDVALPSDRIRQLPHTDDANKTFESFDLSSDGKRVLLSARGELWNAPAKPGGRTIDITHDDSGIRERQPAFSPDGKQVVCIADGTGEQELTLFSSDGKGEPKTITHGKKGWIFPPVWSPDSKFISYADFTGTLFLVDPKTGESKTVDQDKNWELTEYNFSPDGKWLAYAKLGENHNQSLWLYDIASAKSTQITSGFTSDHTPAWDPKGKYLYFLSERVFRPELDDLDTTFLITQSAKPCVMILTKDGKSPLLPEELLEDADEKKPASKPATTSTSEPSSKPATTSTSAPTVQPASTQSDAADEDDKKPKLPEVKIDLPDIQRRVVEVPVDRDNCSNLTAIENKIFWVTAPTHAMGEGEEKQPSDATSALQSYDFEKRKAEEFVDSINAYAVSRDGKKLAYKKGGDVIVVGTDAKPSGDGDEKVHVSALPLTVDPVAEWKQIYAEAWRLQRDFFWAPNMVGLDWPAIGKKYEPLLERIATRGELTDVIGQLIGELGNSHTYVFGGEVNFKPPPSVPVGVLGAEIEVEPKSQLHQFIKVYEPEVWETETAAPLTMSNARVKEGDYLLAVNGVDLKPSDNADAKLINLSDVQVQLTVCSKSDKSDARDVQIKTLKDDVELRYADWCRRNREFVDKATDGKVGYIHLPDMEDAGLIRFVEGFYPQINKDALIIDERGNHGGFVSQMIIEKLARHPWAYDTPRRGQGSTYPARVFAGYKCVLLNQHSGSDGDIFPDSFRQLGLGPLIGKRSWGGVIGIRTDKGFIDNGMSSQPEFAWWDPKRGWAIENHGVDPDIEVEYRPEDYIASRDPQLQRGIDEMMKKIKEHPVERPEHPAFPNRAPSTRP